MRKWNFSWGAAAAGLCAGLVTGLFGAGGGMLLVPLLTLLTGIEEQAVFSTSLSVMLPISIVTLLLTAASGHLALFPALPYLVGSILGGFCAGKWGHRIPVKWLHRGLGCLILWGGIRYLC